jgi:hypothetical protein
LHASVRRPQRHEDPKDDDAIIRMRLPKDFIGASSFFFMVWNASSQSASHCFRAIAGVDRSVSRVGARAGFAILRQTFVRRCLAALFAQMV